MLYIFVHWSPSLPIYRATHLSLRKIPVRIDISVRPSKREKKINNGPCFPHPASLSHEHINKRNLKRLNERQHRKKYSFISSLYLNCSGAREGKTQYQFMYWTFMSTCICSCVL